MPLNRESTIRVLRSTGSTDPAGLTFGELAYVGGNGKLFMGTTAGESLWIGTGITTGALSTSATLVPTQSAVKTYVDAAIGGSVVNTFNGTSGAISLTGNGAILYTQSGGTNTISARLAGIGVTGVASFSSTSFAVSAGGEVTIANDGVSNLQLVSDSVTVTAGNGLAGGGAVALGGTTTLTNAGVTGVVAGTGIAVSGATGNVTITNTGVQTFNGSTAAISLTGNGAILYTQSGGTNTISARLAGIGVTGVASFTGTSFAVSAGAEVTIKTAGVSNLQLVNSTHPISAGGASTLNLGDTLTLTGGSNITLSNTANTITLGLANDVVIAGNLTVNGTVVTANVASFVVEDPMIALGTGNSNNTVDLGFYAQYMAAENTGRLFTGLFRDATDGKYKLFTGLTGNAEPTITVDTGGSGYTVATLVLGIDGGTF